MTAGHRCSKRASHKTSKPLLKASKYISPKGSLLNIFFHVLYSYRLVSVPLKECFLFLVYYDFLVFILSTLIFLVGRSGILSVEK